jgi:type I restriction enzyme, S subunit
MRKNLVPLSSVAEIIAGQSPESKYYNTSGEGLPFFQGKADFNGTYPTIRSFTAKTTKIALPNDILLSVRAPVGPTNICNVESCIGRGLAAIRPGKDLHYKYVYYFFKTIEERLAASGNGSTFSAITTGVVRDLLIPLPPLPIQKKIATILDKADSLRQKDKQLLEHYKKLTQSIFYDMFGNVASNSKGWKTATLPEFIHKKKYSLKRGPFGGALKKEIFVDDGYLVYEQYHAINDDFSLARYFITKDKYKELEMFSVKPGDLIVSCSGVTLGRIAEIPVDAREGIINQALLKITLDFQKCNNIYFKFLFRSSFIQDILFGVSRGSGIPNFPPMTTINALKFPIPPIDLQNEFLEIVRSLEIQKKSVQDSLSYSEKLFQTLIQKAFKGELVKES